MFIENIKFWRCTVCGWLHEGETPPAHCPRCGAPAEKFVPVNPPEYGFGEEKLDEEVVVVPVKELTPEDKKRIEPALFKITYGLYIVGSFDGDKLNGQVCNTAFQITSTPMRVVIGINNKNYTNELIKKTGFFSLCVLSKDGFKMVQNFGFRSGREHDKFDGIAYRRGVTGAPIIEDCIAWVECRVEEKATVDVGTHTMFVGEVVEGGINRDADPMTYDYYRKNRRNVNVVAGTSKPDVKRWMCKVCGYIYEGEEPPEVCPLCGAPREQFELVQEESDLAMTVKTNENLMSAFSGESQANRKYLAFAAKAEKEGFKNIARLFRAVAEAETIHALKHLEVAGQVGDTLENLKAAQQGEHYEFTQMYPEFIKQAEADGHKAALRSFNFANEAEKVHGDLYEKAVRQVADGNDISDEAIHLCPVCGYVVQGQAPEKCPICGAPAKTFKKY
ncbi:MAG: hypothetical protein PWP31_811 [Clostridia bacterium]|nr:hypothetical protein [Clostridia bacterium]